MKRLVPVLLSALVLASASAGACEPEDICEAPASQRYPSLGRSIGITLDPDWIESNIDAIHGSFGPGCDAFASCLAVWGNPVEFCRLLLTIELRQECDERWDHEAERRDWQQCKAVADIYSVSQTRRANAAWPDVQKCVASQQGEEANLSPRLEVEPEAPRPGQDTDFVVRAFHPETGARMYGLVTVGGRQVGPTFQEFHFDFGFERRTDSLGRIMLESPEIVVRSSPARGSGYPGFREVTARFATPIPTTVLAFEPPQDQWKEGRNEIRVTARDRDSGNIIVGTLMAPGVVLGEAGESIRIDLEGESLCGEPVWFRSRELDRPDVDLPIPPCS